MQNIQAKRPRRSREQWAIEVERWRRSGQTAAVYAAAHGLHEGTLAGWAAKLGSRRTEHKEAQERFLPVRVVPPVRPAKRAALEVVLRNGRRIRIEDGFDRELLARLIAVVEGSAEC